MALAIVPNRTGGGMPFFQPEDPNALPMGEAPPMIAAAAQPEPQMAAASSQSPSGIMGFLQNPDNQAKMMAFGQGLSQLGAGQAPNIAANPAYQAMMQRQQEGQQRKQMAGLLDGLPPEMRRVLAQMPPQLAQKIILEYTMAQMAPKEPPKLPTSVQEFQYAQENPDFAEFLKGDPASEQTTAMQTLHQRAIAAGLQPGTEDYQAFMFSGGAGKGEELVVSPDGTVRLTRGGSSNDPTDASNPTSAAAMIATVDSVLNDPALESATGALSFTQAVPGTGMYRFGTKVRQLQGQAFLQAYEYLKGAGQITEVEGTKAEAAIGRLDSAQSAEDYRAALLELRGVLEAAAARQAGVAAPDTAQKRLRYNPATGAFE